MRLRAPAAALVAALLVAACGSRPPHPRFDQARVATSIAASTTVTSPPTTVAPTTTIAAAAPTAPAALADAKAVRSATGVALTVVGHDGPAVKALTPCENTVTLSNVTAIAPPVVILDPGHGGSEPGAVGPNGLTEKALNLAVSIATRDALEAAGASTLLTRASDYRMTLVARTRLVTALKPRAFVSVHHNADPDGPLEQPGSETYYQVASNTSAESKRLAGLIYEEIVAALRPYNVAWVGDTDAGAKYRQGSTGDDYYAVLRQTKGVVASLAELAFISNGPEAELLARPEVQQAEGQAVARGIIRFLNTGDPGSGFTQPYSRTTPAGGGGRGANCTDPPL
jgi:N-acetylmuramoyl-L-alanine amidase